MLTKKDLTQIKAVVSLELDDKLEKTFSEKLKCLPSKDDFFTRMDELSSEIKKSREEFTLHTGQHREIHDRLDRHHKRLSNLEKINKLPVSIDEN